MAESAALPASITSARWPRWLLLAGRIILGALFAYAAYTKLSQPWILFAFSINSYQMLPDWAVTVLARSLPWFELALGLWLLIGWKLRWAATAASALLAVFFAAMLRAYFKNLAIDCGCFGFGEKLGPMRLALESAILAVAFSVAIGAFVIHRRKS